jgi:site-specific DNA-methyltransferase (adenine-specific)
MQIRLGDNAEILKSFDNDMFDMIYLDPPYATGIDYYMHGQFCFTDKINNNDLYFMIDNVLRKCYNLLKPTGTLYLHSTYKVLHLLQTAAVIYFKHVNTIIWHYNSAPHREKDLGNRHDPILRLVKSKDYKFNPIYEPYATKVDYSLGYNPEGKLIGDVWRIPIMPQNDREERTGYPTQKPLELMERLIKLATDENDLILDPFMGSGTTLVAAKMLNRECIGIDQSKIACETAKRRLETCL